MLISNWQLIKIGFFIALGWWIASGLSMVFDVMAQFVMIAMQNQGT